MADKQPDRAGPPTPSPRKRPAPAKKPAGYRAPERSDMRPKAKRRGYETR